jgi:hypothetical protein
MCAFTSVARCVKVAKPFEYSLKLYLIEKADCMNPIWDPLKIMSSESGNTNSGEPNHWYLWFMAASVFGVMIAHIATALNTEPLALYASWASLGLWAIGIIGVLNAERKQDGQAKERSTN